MSTATAGWDIASHGHGPTVRVRFDRHAREPDDDMHPDPAAAADVPWPITIDFAHPAHWRRVAVA
jgi:hypothetical protein